jgi:hydroxymethylbilane synthase
VAIRIGTRRSRLALAQAREVADAIAAAGAGARIVPVATRGDRTTGALGPAGGKGLFTAALEDRLRRGEIDLAVHSAKDVPVEMDADLALVAAPPRADPRDAVVSPHGGLADLPEGATVATGSLRRRAQVLAARGDLSVVPIRGNVDTRIRKLLAGGPLHALLLAVAGLHRAGLAEAHGGIIHPLDADAFIPAAGQGTLAVQALAANAPAAAAARTIDDAAAHAALLAERQVLRALGADCHSCIAAHVSPAETGWRGVAMSAEADGSGLVRSEAAGETAEAVAASLVAGLGGG